MKIAATVARYLLGLLFTVFGLNGFLHFIHQPPPSNPLALHFLGAVIGSHFAEFFFAVQVLGGLLLLLAFHLMFESGAGIGPGLVACVLWVLLFIQYRESFNGIFSARPATQL